MISAMIDFIVYRGKKKKKKRPILENNINWKI